jgi:hypothetical protein
MSADNDGSSPNVSAFLTPWASHHRYGSPTIRVIQLPPSPANEGTPDRRRYRRRGNQRHGPSFRGEVAQRPLRTTTSN